MNLSFNFFIFWDCFMKIMDKDQEDDDEKNISEDDEEKKLGVNHST